MFPHPHLERAPHLLLSGHKCPRLNSEHDNFNLSLMATRRIHERNWASVLAAEVGVALRKRRNYVAVVESAKYRALFSHFDHEAWETRCWEPHEHIHAMR